MINQELLLELTESYLKSLLSETCNSLRPDFDSFAPFGELGIDSFFVLKIVKKLEADFGTLPKTLLFEYFNINSLATYFINKYDQTLSTLFSKELEYSRFSEDTKQPALTVELTPPVYYAKEIQNNKRNEIVNIADKLAVKKPILLLEKNAFNDPQLGALLQSIYDQYKNESSVSRGTRNIAPNIFIGSEKHGYFNYSRSKNIILAYGYTGPDDYFSEIVDELYHYCISNNFELNIFNDNELGLIGGAPFSATPFGVMQRVLNIQDFTLEGGAMRRLRYQVSKFEKTGLCKTEEYQCGSNPDTDKGIASIIDQWCETKAMVNPLIHIVKEEILAGSLNPQHRIFLTYLDDTLQNVILISKLSSNMNGYLMDLEFYPKDMPLGGLEFAIVKIIAILVAEGCHLFSLGGTYGCKLNPSSNPDPALEKILDDLRMQNIFNDDGNLQFKNKFRPENSSIFLCRPVENSNPDNVIDVIMMIADPAKMQTSDEENHKTYNQEEISKTTQEIQTTQEKIADKLVIENVQGSVVLSEFGYNPHNVPDDLIEFDLKTDSWAQLSNMRAVDQQMKRLYSQLQQPVNVEQSLKGIFPFNYFVLASSGREAENIFCSAFEKKGVVLQNLLFPTWIFSQINHDFTPVELPSSDVFDLHSSRLYKGNMDVDALQQQLTSNSKSIAFVCIEVSDNAAGGYPVSIDNLKRVKHLLTQYDIPLVIDGTRVVENAQFIIEHEKDFSHKMLWDVVKEIFSYADAITVSLAKDFCVNKGGLIATNDVNLFNKIQNTIDEKGGSLDTIDKKIVALSLKDLTNIETQVSRRTQAVRLIWSVLIQHSIPVVQPAGTHCILIDVKQIPEFQGFLYPVASFVAWVYLNTGIRVGAHNAGMQKNSPISDLVRLAIPLGLNYDEADTIANKLIQLFAKKENIPEIILTEKESESFGDIYANYFLKQYHNTAAKLIVNASDVAAAKRHSATSVVENNTQTSLSATSSLKTNNHDAINNNTHISPSIYPLSRSEQPEEIAIVGMAGRYPKAKNLNDMWENLLQGRDCIDSISDARFDRRRQHASSEKYRGGFIDEVDRFDSLFFNISPREAETLDPQERLFLEVAWEALEDAGYYPETLVEDSAPRNIGVFVGAVWSMYHSVGAEERLLGNHVIASSFLWSIANRVSYFMNLCGPSMAVDTACSASLTALYLAIESIQKGECSSAIVGGVNLDIHPCKQEITLAGGLLSQDGVCRTFGKGANGYVPGEGVGAIFLKPLKQAVEDGDNIHGVVKSIAINHGGRTSGYSVPNSKAQSELIVAALKKANIDARTIGYIEAHGTGTELGDPIEITGLTTAFQSYNVSNQTCAIGSVKTNIGHLEAAAGIVGVCKVLLQMRHRKLVPSLHSTELNEFIDFKNSPFYVEQNIEEWKGKHVDGLLFPLRAGISSFGAGGSNAHIILEEYAPLHNRVAEANPHVSEHIFPISARNEEQLREAAIRLKEFVEKELSQSAPRLLDSLQNIAHTLQVGRKSFDYRLAIIASTKHELIEKLSCFIHDRKHEGVMTGHVKNAENITKLLTRKEKEAFVEMLSVGRNPLKLVKLWIDGLLSDWQGLQTSVSAVKISLPTYPFADKRHWLTEPSSLITHGAPQSVIAMQNVLHPLLDTNESTFERQIFKKTFNEQEFFIYDHLVSDIPTLPGVAYLDLVRKAGELAAGKKVQKIKNILWVSPLTVENSIPNETFVELKPNGDVIQFEVFSWREDGKKQLYSQGKLSYANEQELNAEPEYIDIAAIRARCEKIIDGKDAYPLFKSLGLHLGPSFQVLQSVYKNDSEVLGALSIPASRASDFHDFILHPSLVDGSFQALMGAQLGDKNGAGGMVVPYSLGEVEILYPLTLNCFSYVVDAKDHKKSVSNLSKKNVFIVDEEGKILVKVRDSVGVPLTDVHEKPDQQSAQVNVAADDGFVKLFYSTLWEPSPLITNELNNTSILLFAQDESFRKLYQERLEQTGQNLQQVILVLPDDTYQAVDSCTYRINPKNRSDFTQLFNALKQQEWPIEKICFAWTTNSSEFNPTDYAEISIKDALDKGVYAFLSLCQVIVEQKLENKVQLQYLYTTQKNQPQPHHEAMNGFAKILQAESPKFNCKILEIQQDTLALNNDVLDAVLSEFQENAQGALTVRYQDKKRYIRKIKEFDLEETRDTSAQYLGIKEQGVYLITGGAGGLGLIFAEYLAKTYRAKLVLTGRSKLSAVQESKLEELKTFGADVLYIPADVSHFTDVHTLIEQSKAHFGSINGIIHSAGVLRDSYIRNKKPEDMGAVFDPKLFGTLHLDEATKNDALDFFVMFSSLAALAGNAGQSDYSFANHFMDSFAHKREVLQKIGQRSGKTLSLNWSLWADGGMQLDEPTKQFFKKNLGIKPLSSDVGIEAFIKGLSSSKSSFAVIEGVQDKIERAWGIRQEDVVAPVAVQVSDTSKASPLVASSSSGMPDIQQDGDELVLLVQAQLSKIVMDFLKLDAEDVDYDTILLDLGFDSIGLTTFANAVNEKYGLDVTPVLFFEFPNIREIGKYLAEEHKDEMLRVHKSVASGSKAEQTSRTESVITKSVSHIAVSEEITFGKNKGWNPDVVVKTETTISSAGSFSPARRFVERPIAVVGMSGVMPQSDDLEEFWKNLHNAQDTMVTLIPKDRWNWEDYYGDPLTEENKTKSKWGGFMREVDKFDPLFWGISPREAEMMDPQQRIFLETVWKAVEDSGQKVSDLAGTKTGLFVGVATKDYVELMGSLDVELDEYAAPGTSHAILANRVSFLLGLNGPSAPLDTACSSSLVALHRAIESIHTGSSDMAIVGGVQVMLTPSAFISFGAAGMLANDGKTKSFDEHGDGYVRGEGSGAIFIKPLDMAEADGNHIYALIKATAENHGGRATMLTAPNPTAQAALLVEAYQKAEIDPTTVGYIECHGTGTSLGDPIEFQAMKKAFSELYKKHNKTPAVTPHIGLTSVKSNIGHLETAAGISGVLKVLLSLKHKQIPALLHFEKLNSYISLEGTPFYMVDKTIPWPAIEAKDGTPLPRIAGVSSFGFGGANAHIIFEEYLPRNQKPVSDIDGPHLIVLSAKNEDRLKAYTQKMLDYVDSQEFNLADFAYTLQVGRDEMPERLALVASDSKELKRKFLEFLQSEGKANSVFRNNTQTNKGRFKTLVEGKAGKAFLHALVEQKDVAKLAELWVSGVEIDWPLFYVENIPKRIAIPTYPFARERCWPASRVNTGKTKSSIVAIAQSEQDNDVGVKNSQASSQNSIEKPSLLSTSAFNELIEVVENITVLVFSSNPDDSSETGADLSLSSENKAVLFVQQLIATQLQVSIENVDVDCYLMDTGITSMGMAEMTQSIKEIIDPRFSPAMFFECTTPRSLAIALAEVYPAELQKIIVIKKVIQGIGKRSVFSPEQNQIPSGKVLTNDNNSIVPSSFNDKEKSLVENVLIQTDSFDQSELQKTKNDLTKQPLHIQDSESELIFTLPKGISIEREEKLSSVLITGATGYLGVHILSELLNSNVEILATCLVRAINKEQALDRILNQAKKFELNFDVSRIKVICGDINKPQLGLIDAEWNHCCRDIQQIIHASAHVNHIEGYATFRDATRGMKEIIRLASSEKLKLIHFISSIAVCARKKDNRVSIYEKEEFIEDGISVYGGYGQSKWAQETLLKRAYEHGVPYAIYRFGELSGSSETGLGQTDDMLHRLLQMKLAIGCKEKISNDVLDMLPVDFAAKMIVSVGKYSEVWNRIFHATHPTPYPMPYVYKCAEEHGLSFVPTSKAQYLIQCHDYIRYATSLNPVDGFVLECVFRNLGGASKNMSMVDGYFAILFPFNQNNFKESLVVMNLNIPNWKNLLELYFRRWKQIDSGYMAKIYGYQQWFPLNKSQENTLVIDNASSQNVIAKENIKTNKASKTTNDNNGKKVEVTNEN